MTISRVFVANRGEIALRVIRACQGLGLSTVLAASEVDLDSLPAQIADRTVCVGPARASDSYLRVDSMVTAAVATGADALHPGYGFLAESPALAEACGSAGIVFVGPTAEQMRTMGNKIEARRQAEASCVPVLPGSERVADAGEALRVAQRIGFPVMLKAAGGGGGKGMKIVTDPATLVRQFDSVSVEVEAAFGDPTIYLERFVSSARHVEVQVVGDHYGTVVHVGERDCSLQRRHQKLVEESPAPGLPDSLLAAVRGSAVALAADVGYRGAGTVEFLIDAATGQYFFLEMNTRIQVEHPVTEMVSGIDLVEAQLRIASGEPLWFDQQDVAMRGHAIECRINAEIPEDEFRPNAGRIHCYEPPVGPFLRIDSHCFAGYSVPLYYDSLLAKVIVYGATRDEALWRICNALDSFHIEGVHTTIPFLRHALRSQAFVAGTVHTRLVDEQLLRAFRDMCGVPYPGSAAAVIHNRGCDTFHCHEPEDQRNCFTDGVALPGLVNANSSIPSTAAESHRVSLDGTDG